LREAAEWRLLGLLFEPPHEGWRDEVAALAAEIGDVELVAAARQALDEADAGLYHSTFGPGGPASPREVSYYVTMVPGGLLSELGAYYAAFGYESSLAETPDHVAVETGFVAYLKLKQAYATEFGITEQAAVAAEAAARFLTEHLAVVAARLEALLAASGIGYLAKSAELLRRRTGDPPPSNAVLPVVASVPSDLAQPE
jgi:nitrate reductase assembly molybdenum cofactor insertion protein NarJ